jgi:hypothetical protein
VAYEEARNLEPGTVPRSHQDVRRLFRDFLREIYLYTEEQLRDSLAGRSWKDANIEFSFSVPTTWTALGVTKDFEKIVQEAGFGKGGRQHSVSVGLTEAEAAAVYTFKTQEWQFKVSNCPSPTLSYPSDPV